MLVDAQEHREALTEMKRRLRALKCGTEIITEDFSVHSAALSLAQDHDAQEAFIAHMQGVLTQAQNYIIAAQSYVNLQVIDQNTPTKGLILLFGKLGYTIGAWNGRDWQSEDGKYRSASSDPNQHPTHWALIARPVGEAMVNPPKDGE